MDKEQGISIIILKPCMPVYSYPKDHLSLPEKIEITLINAVLIIDTLCPRSSDPFYIIVIVICTTL